MLPEFIYSKLPAIYLLVGILGIYNFYDESKFGVASSCVFLVVSLLVYRLRYEYKVKYK